MVYLFASRHKKTAAFFMLTIFYCDFVLAGYMPIRESMTMAVYHKSYNANIITGNSSNADVNNEQVFTPVEEATYDHPTPIVNENSEDFDEDGGPSQPEMESFRSVGTNNMVDLFSGDFSYSIPLLDAGGYPINLFYRSGISMDQEASWVGLGWNINPGTITRNLRGLPDDFNGAEDKITKTINIKENKTAGATIGGSAEVFGLPLPITGNLGVFHNNYKGWGIEGGISATLNAGKNAAGPLSGGLSLQSNTQEGVSITPSVSLSVKLNGESSDAIETVQGTGSISTSLSYNTRAGLRSLQVSGGVNFKETKYKTQTLEGGKVARATGADNVAGIGNIGETLFSSSISLAAKSYTPTISIPYTSNQTSFTAKVGGEIFGLDGHVFVSGYVTSTRIAIEDRTQVRPAYGYLNFQEANGDQSVLLDFNREKDIPYREKPVIPNIGIPSYTYDIFSINGEGTGGTFRAYRGDIGYVYDHQMQTKSESGSLSVDVGTGGYFHAGVDFNDNSSITTSGPWVEQNALRNSIGFRKSNAAFEAVYFRNPGEKAIVSKSFYENLGGDDVVTPEIYQSSPSSSYILATNKLKRYRNTLQVGSTTLSSNTVREKRDKRVETITYLTADEASKVGLSKYIENYGINKWKLNICNKQLTENEPYKRLFEDTLTIEKRVNSFRKANHISEVDVLNPDGRRYIYGIPVYNLKQTDITSAVNKDSSTLAEGLVQYTDAVSNPIVNPDNHGTLGRDDYYSKEEMPSYAHSFLLTAIVSPDYSDLTGDGITDDDLGDAVKFNYSRVAGTVITNEKPYTWRAPYITDSATYNEGLKTETKDDRASYIYGEKELWYMHSIESKNMIVTFKLEDRKDALPINEQGKKIAADNPAKLLREINLYTKADFIKNGANAKPIKTVHFGYSYSLCRGVYRTVANPQYDSGKLTLDTVYFTYNGNKKKQNVYYFFYNKNNPRYNTKSFDRWGNYKDENQNPGASDNKPSNAEFPYAVQDSVLAAGNVGAWNLDSIILPSKAKIKVSYESDDYAFVQNKRAAQIFKIAGFAMDQPNANTIPTNSLYDDDKSSRYIFARVSEPVTTNQEVFEKYLQGIEKIFFKLFVGYPKGYEYVPGYADIDFTDGAGSAYGVTADPKIIWLKVKGIDIKKGTVGGSFSPLAKAAIQFLRINLPGQAYNNSEVGDDIGVKETVQMLGTMIGNLSEILKLYDFTAMQKGLARYIDTAKSLVRLNNPTYKKYGGGLRVRTITLYDGWDEMTQQRKSTYGQHYFYTTTKQINGKQMEISSGVASYEPSIGSEENPWKQPLEIIERVAALAPTTLSYTETPLGEGFFPSPHVGYSCVRVKSIHADTVKSYTGFEETKFFTTYDFPTFTDNTTLLDNKKRFSPGLAKILKINARNYISISQGFKIDLNDMNGKMRSQASYPANDPTAAIAYTENFYRVENPAAEVKRLSNTVMTIDADGTIDTTALIGKDVELMFDMRQEHTLINGNNYNANVDVIPALFGIPFPFPSFWYLPQREEDLYRSVAVTKVINRYGIVDSVIAVDKGSRIATKNLLYDSETGEVLLTQTQNEFNDPIYNFTYPAHWAYSGMGPAYKNIQAVFNSDENNKIKINNGFLQPTSKYPNMIGYFESGDEIMVTGRIKTGEEEQLDCNGAEKSCPTNLYAADPSTTMIWAVDVKKIDPNSSDGIVFIDRQGNPYSATDVKMKIIRSGRRNMSMSPVSTVTFMKNPIQVVSNKLKLVLTNDKDVVATGAIVYKDFWKTNEIMYLKDTSTTVFNQYSVSIMPSVTRKEYVHSNEGSDNPKDVDGTAGTHADAQYIGASLDYQGENDEDIAGSCNTKHLKNKSILQFNLDNIPQSATVNSASLTFTPKIPNSTYSPIRLTGATDNDCHSYDWNNATQFYNGSSNVSLKRITNAWSNSTNYDDILTTDVNKVAITQTNYSNINCKLLMQDLIESNTRMNGLLFVLDDETLGNYNDKRNYLTFCGGNSCSSILNMTYTSPETQSWTVCRSAITQRSLNPYVYGILGNWRSDKSYVFYGERQQADPTVVTNIRKDGAIQDYAPYWSFTNSYLAPTTDTTKWVWNSQITIFNKKGYELENKDPLGRYNSGLYGYNQTLPISVTQNSRYREQFFDGFEDYSFDNKSCPDPCPLPRTVDFTSMGGVRDTLNTHTGRYSLKVAGGDSSMVSIKTVSTNIDTVSVKMQSALQHKYLIDTSVTAHGSGQFAITNNITCSGNQKPLGWSTSLLVEETGQYIITISDVYCGSCVGSATDNNISFGIFGSGAFANADISFGTAQLTVSLKAGEYYLITVAGRPYENSSNFCYIQNQPSLRWQKTGNCGFSSTPVPSVNLYAPSDDTTGSVHREITDCSSFSGITTDSTMLIREFSLTQDGKYWFSSWVKESEQCLTGTYTNNEVQFLFYNASNSQVGSVIAKPSGNIIEGWQRYDQVISVPTAATKMVVKLKNKGSGDVYFDDFRLHPNSANMQSFVYDPVSLRLMAQLDENNYASFYEYDDDGTLIRVKKETIQGIQTIKETRSYLVQ